MITKILLQRAYMADPDQGSLAPSSLEDLAKTCVAYVEKALALTLDYTPETLPILDHYVRTKADRPQGELAELLRSTLGAYFGEVVRRSIAGARWYAPGEDYAVYRLEFDPYFLCFNPVGVAAEVLAQDDVEGYGTHFQLLDDARPVVEDALAKSDSVSVDDYYSFSTRYETLELVTSVLVGLESLTQKHPRRFGPEVYRAASSRATPTGSLS